MLHNDTPHAGIYEIPLKSPHLLAIRKAVRKQLNKNTEYILGLSGGVDSLALAAALSAEDYKVKAVIVDHQLQADHVEFSRKAYNNAVALGLDAEIVTVDVPVTSQGMEAEARVARYKALCSYNKPVLIAHTMNDQVETVLMAMAKNTGVNSLTGMKPVSYRDGHVIVRPMLYDIERKDTKGACLELGIDWWEDPQNSDESYRRVAVRKRLIPVMQDVFGYDIVRRFADTFREVSQYKDIVDDMSQKLYQECSSPYMLHTEKLLDEDETIVKNIIVMFLQDYNVPYHSAGVQHIYNMIVNWHGQGDAEFKGFTVGHHSKYIIMIKPKDM